MHQIKKVILCSKYEGLLLHAFNSTKNAPIPEIFGACTLKWDITLYGIDDQSG